MRRTRTPAAALATLLLLTFTAACGDDGGDDDEDAGGTTTTTESVDEDTTTTTEAEDDPDETTTTVLDDEGIGAVEELARSLLVTVDELGLSDFQDAGYVPQDGPNACGFDLDAEHPSEVLVGTTLGNSELVFQQEIRVYPSAEEAAAAFEAGVAGATCDEPADGSVLGDPIDVNERVGADQAVAIEASTDGFEAVVVATLLSDAVVSFQFGGAPGAAEAAGAPDPLDVAAFGVGKIRAALEEG